jgi:RNA polymerase sigma factor (TIGR02999 family)
MDRMPSQQPGPGRPDASESMSPAQAEMRATVTSLLLDARGGAPGALDELFPLVYDELRRLAQSQLRAESEGHTLQATALVHEAYVRLVDQTRAQWQNRAQFMAVAACSMRRVLVDYARRYRAAKRGGGWQRIDLEDVQLPLAGRADALIELDDALERLAALNPRLTRVIECRYFGGLTEEETAAALSVTDRTVRRDWIKARGWLARELGFAG